MIGVNAASSQGSEAYITGKTNNPYATSKAQNHNYAWLIVFVISIFFAIGVVLYLRWRKQQKAKMGTTEVEDLDSKQEAFAPNINESVDTEEEKSPHYLKAEPNASLKEEKLNNLERPDE